MEAAGATRSAWPPPAATRRSLRWRSTLTGALAVGTVDNRSMGAVQLWDMTDKPPQPIFTAHDQQAVPAVAFGRDGSGVGM